MDKKEVITFFDALADSWDDMQDRNEEVINLILDKSEVTRDSVVLDIACGTGVLFGDYLDRGALVTGIDISGEMLKIAKKKFPQVRLICGDAETYNFEKEYDVVMIYNAFPHFPNPENLIENLSKSLKKGGRLTVAHGLSMAELEKCHSGKAKSVSQPLPCKEALAEIMSPYIKADIMISDDRMYMVSGIKK
jgi:demethylmenaquinone methyltransferase/2-methoxy-6-polyprenyl-1,4-benzoquinol methylase